MRVLALGGPGAMGAVAVRVAAGLPGVQEIIVADRHLSGAERLVRALRGDRAPLRASRVDVTDERRLRAVLTESDVVLNTVGPYYRFGLTVLRAAIDTRTHYLDICDDWEPTQQMLRLSGEAAAAGVCALLGMGASPGVSNLLAARAVRGLDTVEHLYTAWPVDAPGSGNGKGNGTGTGTGTGTRKRNRRREDELLLGPDGRPTAASVHWMQQISGEVAEVRSGALVRRPPLHPVRLSLPGGRLGTAYTVGHPEPVTLIRSYHPTGDAANLMIIKRGTIAYLDVLREDIDNGRLTNEAAAADLARPTLRRAVRAALRSGRFRAPLSLPPFFAVASGIRNGRPITVLARLAGPTGEAGEAGEADLMEDMAEATGVPLALGLAQFLDGSVPRLGVHPPETLIDADRFFRDLARHRGRRTGDVPPGRTEDDVLIEESPIPPVRAVRGPSTPHPGSPGCEA